MNTAFDFSTLPRPRGSYTQTLRNYREGTLSLGFLWELTQFDEVFGAFLRRNGVETLRADE